MIVIANKGNMNGKSGLENHPLHIKRALDAGFGVRVDVWEKDGKVYSGNTKPQYPLPDSILENDDVWFSAHDHSVAELLNSKKIVEYIDESLQSGEKFVFQEHQEIVEKSKKIILMADDINKCDIGTGVYALCTNKANKYE